VLSESSVSEGNCFEKSRLARRDSQCGEIQTESAECGEVVVVTMRGMRGTILRDGAGAAPYFSHEMGGGEMPRRG
jgi:hypothetical protein